ncbi:MAG: EFR1 family ferrodoxin [Clostridia bacterium]|nr:EFR1 family ferrodoxin [Clostridia bacterium]
MSGASDFHNRSLKRSKIVYFSGTGGAKRVADCFEKLLTEKSIEVQKVSLDMQECKDCGLQEEEQLADILILIYAVHALDAPEPVYDWIAGLPYGNGIPVAVISVSGGGEVWPNSACRVGSIKEFERKGYEVTYERMLVMPSNWIIGINDQLGGWLLRVLPLKAECCISDILSGVRRRTRLHISSWIMTAVLSKQEKKEAKRFGMDLKIHNSCTGCGWCAKSCPRKNISMENGNPVFGERCIICLRCIYGCPSKSIYTKKYSFVQVKEGFDLNALEKRMKGVELEPVKKVCKGVLLLGVRKYLLEKD